MPWSSIVTKYVEGPFDSIVIVAINYAGLKEQAATLLAEQIV
jgi:hypothetical protein